MLGPTIQSLLLTGIFKTHLHASEDEIRLKVQITVPGMIPQISVFNVCQ